MIKVMLCAALAVVLSCHPAHAGDTGCDKLRVAEAYGPKFKSFIYLLPGQNGWFFRTKQDLRPDFKVSDTMLAPYQDFVAALRRKNVELVIAYAATRGIIERDNVPTGDKLTQGYDPTLAARSYTDFLAAVNKAGIMMVGNAQPHTVRPYFYKADHHWSSAGAASMADALADKIKGLPVYASLPKKKFVTKIDKSVAFKGSFGKVITAVCGTEVADETDDLTVTSEQNAATDPNALFGDTTLPAITLVGTSNSKKENNNVNFDGLLKERLSVDVLNRAISGGGMDEPMLAYLASDEFHAQPPKIIIWEVPGYYDFKSKAARALMLQTTAAVDGDCGDKALATAEMPLTAQAQPLFPQLAAKNLTGAAHYLYLKFDQPISKDVETVMNYADGQTESFKFKRTKLYPYDGLYYYALQTGAALQDIILKTNPKLAGGHVTARLCRLPDPQIHPAAMSAKTGQTKTEPANTKQIAAKTKTASQPQRSFWQKLFKR